MKDILLVSGFIALGWFLRGCKENARRLKEENAVLVARAREQANKDNNQ